MSLNRRISRAFTRLVLDTPITPNLFDDDTFTADRPRAEAIAKLLGPLGVTWSCNSRANVPYDTLKVMKDNGLRLLLVGFESGNDRILRNIKKGVTLERGRRFMADCKKLGILVHGTFILGLPGETSGTIRETMAFAMEVDPYSIQVSLATPYPGTEFYDQAVRNDWLVPDDLVPWMAPRTSPSSTPASTAGRCSKAWRCSTNGSTSARRRFCGWSARW